MLGKDLVNHRGLPTKFLPCWIAMQAHRQPFITTSWTQRLHSLTAESACGLQGDASDSKDSEAKPGPYWSLMFEISESKLKPVNQKPTSLAGAKWPEIVKETIIGALNTKMVDAKDEIVSVYHRYLSSLLPGS